MAGLRSLAGVPGPALGKDERTAGKVNGGPRDGGPSAGVEGWPQLVAAVEEALRLGTCDAGAVLYLLREPDEEARERSQVALAVELERFERSMPDMDEYDQLLIGSVQ